MLIWYSAQVSTHLPHGITELNSLWFSDVMMTEICFNSGSGNGVLTNHQWGLVALIWGGVISQEMYKTSSFDTSLKITNSIYYDLQSKPDKVALVLQINADIQEVFIKLCE